jgi:hypothetical protein
MNVFQPLSLLVLAGFGVLVMIGIIPRYKVFKYLMMIILSIVLAPMIFGMGTGKWRELSLMNWPWWYYPVGFLAALIVLRLIINFIFPGRER